MMTKRIFSALLAAALSLSLLAGCGSTSSSTASSAADGPQRYSTVFYDVFDTVTQVIAYCDSEEEFTAQMDALHADLVEYNQLYDIYNDYDGVTNIKTINDNAGIAPVTVDDKILGMLELAQTMKFNPIPMILSEVFCANLGGAATMSGDPPNIIIGTALGLTFGDFLQNTGLIVLVSMVVIVPFFYFAFRKQVATQDEAARQKAMEMDPKASIHSWRKFALNVGVFLLTVVLLITHAKTGLTVAMVGVIAAVLTLLVNKDPILLLKRVDWQTVLFFIGLFLAVSGLEQTGVLEAMAQGIAHITGGSLTLMVIIILWLSGIASAFVDNIPFAATMVPVITSLSATMGVDLNALAWTLSMGTDIGGSGTPIGASANVAGTAIAAREGYAIGWGRYCKYSAPAAVIVLAISMVMLLLRY